MVTLGLALLATATIGDWKLIWSDEFDRPGRPDPKKWTFENGFVRNREHQWYQPENAFVQDGKLIIEARRESKPNPAFDPKRDEWWAKREKIEYTSASLKTQGLQSFLYGRFEMRGKIDTRLGMWPAWWTLGVDKEWPSSGELDILEFYRGQLLANAAWGTRQQYVGQWKTEIRKIESFNDPKWSEKFHTWRMDWSPTEIVMSVDDVVMNRVDLSKTLNPDGFNPFQQPHYMLLNLAIGGDNGGDPANTTFPARFEVDWVRVFSKR